MEEELTKISSLKDRANRFIQSRIEFELSKIKGFMERQVMREPQTIVTTRVEIINGLVARSHRSMSSAIAIAVEEIGGLRTQVRTLSPQATLDRGYSVVQKADGSVLRKASEVKSGEKLRLRLAQGEVGAITE
jgi:exodeoxyribonuclease VII large subunit